MIASLHAVSVHCVGIRGNDMNRVLLATLFLFPVMGYSIGVAPAKAETTATSSGVVESQLRDVEKRI